MWLVVGLGNPGAQYAYNRHNIGFMAVDDIAHDHQFPPFRARFQGQATEGRIATHKVLLLKPSTYMNASGRSVGDAARFYKIAPERIVVVHDDLDLEPGKVRVKRGGGAGGHNGLRSIDSHLGQDYWRVRLGIGHPGHKDRVHGYVLHDFAKSDEQWLDPLMEALSRAFPLFVDGHPDRFMTKVALDMRPPATA